MYRLVVGSAYDAHNAIGDVKANVEIILKLATPVSSLSCYSFSTKYVGKKHKYLKSNNGNLSSLQRLIESNTITKGMAQKIAGSGLHLAHLKLAHSRDETMRISKLFKEKFGGKARVTNTKTIISKVKEYLATH